MKGLNKKERELVAIGAALASNCIPCIVFHIREAQKAGLSDVKIMDAVETAEKIKKVPAEKVLNSARAQYGCEPEGARCMGKNKQSDSCIKKCINPL